MKTFFLLLLFSTSVYSSDYVVDQNFSKVSWQLHISKDTDVHGDISLGKGSFKFTKKASSGQLEFALNQTKSYEINGKDKEWSSSRDDRIYSITSAKKFIPKFKVISISGLSLKEGKQEIEILGNLSLNGVTKKIKVKGSILIKKDSFTFNGNHKLSWNEFKIGNPVMWFLRAAKTADPYINLKFNILATK